MNALDIVKGGTKLAVSVGVGAIVGNVVAFTTPAIGVGLAMRGAIGVGSFVLSNMISDKATEYTDEKIDEVVTTINDIKNGVIDVECQVENEG